MIRDEKWALEQAVLAGRQSTCAKSKRGVVIWHPDEAEFAIGWNAPPEPFQCDGTVECRAMCGQVAVHAEQAALLNWFKLGSRPHAHAHKQGCHLLHIKVSKGVFGGVFGGGEATSSGPPSCLQCSKLIVEARIFQAVWLLHENGLLAYDPIEFHRLTLSYHLGPWVFHIRPNEENPNWPATVKAGNGKTKAEAETETVKLREKACKAVRDGCSSDNLDWLRMIKFLREKCKSRVRRLDGAVDASGGWMDGNCPTMIPPGGLKVVPSFRYGRVEPWWGSNTYRNIYVTFESSPMGTTPTPV